MIETNHYDHCNATVTDCVFSGNTGYWGGMVNRRYSNPTVTRCIFSRNAASDYGGGMYNEVYSNAIVTACRFSGNSAIAGGGMGNADHSSPTVTNSTFSGNTASNFGGGMHNYPDSNPNVINCAFNGNTAGMEGGAMFTYLSTPTLTNCVLWGDSPQEFANYSSVPVMRFNDVQGGMPDWAVDGGGNIDLDPMFVRPPDPGPDGTWDGVDDDYGDLRLQAGSPCIDAGDPAFVPQPGETDLEGHTRVLCEQVDMGAYEFGIGDYDCNQTVDLSDFATWNACMTGPLDASASYSTIVNRQSTIGCDAFDFNADSAVDLLDFAAFQRVLSTP